MNLTQKEKVRQLRRSGTSYAKIASALDLSENTIKSFCKRNQVNRSATHTTDSNGQGQPFCLNCGIPIMQTAGYRVRKYCSDKCRILWWNKHQAAPGRKHTHTFTCQACGMPFDAYGKRERKYCSRSCSARFKAGRP